MSKFNGTLRKPLLFGLENLQKFFKITRNTEFKEFSGFSSVRSMNPVKIYEGFPRKSRMIACYSC